MKKLLVVLTSFALVGTTAACGSSSSESVDLTKIGDFTGLSYDLKEVVPSYLYSEQTGQYFTADQGKEWTNVDGVLAPFISETYDDISMILKLQDVINIVNKAVSSAVGSLKLTGNKVTVAGVSVETDVISGAGLKTKSAGIGTTSKFTYKFSGTANVSVELKSYYELTTTNKCIYSQTTLNAGVSVFSTDLVSATLASCYTIKDNKWESTYAAINAGLKKLSVFDSITMFKKTENGVDVASARKTPLTESRRYITIDGSGNSLSYAYNDGLFSDKYSYQVADNKGNLVFENEMKSASDWSSKWYMYGIQGWTYAGYDANILADEFKIDWQDSTSANWKSSEWGQADKGFFMNGKDKMVALEFDATKNDFVKKEKTIYPYIEQSSSKGGAGAFDLPSGANFKGTSTHAQYVKNELPKLATAFNGVKVEGSNILNKTVSVGTVVKGIKAIFA